VADETIYRCINDACGRPTPRRVKFCPWCGIAQTRAGVRATSGAADVTASPASAAVPPAAPSPAAAPPASAEAKPAAAPSPTGFGHSARPDPAAGASPPPSSPPPSPPHQEVPRPPLAAQPAQRSPIRLRWWLLALAVLWGVWLLAKPSTKKIERQIDAAIALARECKASDAQAGLIALRKTRATPDQLQRLQQALNDEAARCTRQRQRGKAWSDAGSAVESALAAANWDKANTRLQGFTRRWGEDDDTRAMKERIEAARRDSAHPLAVPRSAVGSSGGGATDADGRFQ
jgi:hypothetical protein